MARCGNRPWCWGEFRGAWCATCPPYPFAHPLAPPSPSLLGHPNGVAQLGMHRQLGVGSHAKLLGFCIGKGGGPGDGHHSQVTVCVAARLQFLHGPHAVACSGMRQPAGTVREPKITYAIII